MTPEVIRAGRPFRRCPRWQAWPAALLLSLGGASRAFADVAAMAESLYEQGRQLMSAGQTAAACAKFEESYHLAPATGALLNLAACNESLGKTATAWAQFRSAEVAARHDGRADRVEFAQQHIARLEKLLSYVTIVVPPDLTGSAAQTSLDGTVLGAAAWNVPVPIDPGPHQLVVRTATTAPRTWPFVVRPEDRSNIRIDVGGPPPGSLTTPSPPTATSVGEANRPTTPSGSYRLAGFITLGASAGALIAGSVLGWRAFSRWHAHEDLCRSTAGCPGNDSAPAGEARTAARAADVLFAGGIAAAIASGILFYVSHSRAGAEPAQPTRPGSAMLTPFAGRSSAGVDLSLRW